MTTTLILGPPGTGKTTELLDLVEESFSNGSRPDRVGFISFTRKAVDEARDRACNQFSIDPQDLVYFRTIHSLAFRQLGMSRDDVLNWKNYKDIGHELGVKMSGCRLDDAGFVSVGDQMIALDTRARLSCQPHRQAWELWGEDLDWWRFEQFTRTLAKYKTAHLLYDFTDMLEEFVVKGAVPSLDLLVVDEAQDLSLLQWHIVDRLRAAARDTFIAGDDDQAIFRWSGADVDHFLKAEFADTTRVLDQSWRLPKTVFKLASSVSSRISRRFTKKFHPTEREGAVDFAASLEDVPDLDRGNWLVLVRNNYQVKTVVEHLRYCGYSYTSDTEQPAANDALQAAYTWEAVRKGSQVKSQAARSALAFSSLKAEPLAAGNYLVGRADLESRGYDLGRIWHEALDRIHLDDREYFIAALRRKENLQHPRIKVSTIHGAKGGECENVLLFTDLSAKAASEMWRKPDDEARVFYVGVTRTLNRLCVVEPQTTMSFTL